MTKREELIELLSECTKEQVHFFKRMYSHENLDLPIEDVVKNMLNGTIYTGIRQTKRTILKNQDKLELKLRKLKKIIKGNEN